MTTLVATAKDIATEAHAGQVRRHGTAYIAHPIAVAALARDLAGAVGLPFNDDDDAVALLHDVIEDSPKHTQAVLAAALSPDIAARVTSLTKTGKGDAAVAAYYEALSRTSPLTRLIKVADRLHNLSELHKAHSDAKLNEYVKETQRFVYPLAAGLGGDVARGLVSALDEATTTAERTGGVIRDGASASRRPRKPHGRLYAVVSPRDASDSARAALASRVDALLRAGIGRLQLRVKGQLTDGATLALVKDLAARARPFGVDVVVNDRLDIALAARLDGHAVGVHLGDADLPPRAARSLLGPEAKVGTSTHSVAQHAAMCAEGSACHVALGPIWASPTKQGHADVVGEAALAEAARTASRDVVAIGGVTTPSRAAAAARCGAHLVAVVSAVADGNDDDAHLMVRRLTLAMTAAV